MQEKKRSEIDEKDKWDLKTIYQSEEDLEKDFNMVKIKIAEFINNESSFLKSADNLYKTFKEFYEIEMILEKMWVYTSHTFDTDIADNHNQSLKERVYNLYNDFALNTSFIVPKVLTLTDRQIKQFYQDNSKLKEEYDFVIAQILRNKDHTLSYEEEKLISSLNKATSNTEQIATMLRDSDIDFGYINGDKLTETSYNTYIKSGKREVRKEVFTSLYKAYKQFNNTFALSLSANVEKQVTFSKVRNFKSSLEASLFEDNVDEKVYTNLINTVGNNLDKLYKYYDIKKKALKLDEIHMYDVYVDVVSDQTKKYTFEEAKNLVINSLKVLGNDYIKNLTKAFDERWIDIYPNKNKKGGAYSGGSYLTNPFVLLNFTGDYHDVSTIAHELGHSMHTYYSIKNNPIQYSSYQIFVAEVASQVNEMLFNDYMLNNSNSNEEKLSILNQILELFKGSIFRQTMFAKFEKIISEDCQKGQILTAEYLNSTYYKLVQEYFGDNVVVDEEIKYEWSRIPHFYYNFYVYKYSTGLACACHIVQKILKGDSKAVDNYLQFLKTGGSDYPLNELKQAGVDLTKPEVIQSAMDMFESYLEKFEKLIVR